MNFIIALLSTFILLSPSWAFVIPKSTFNGQQVTNRNSFQVRTQNNIAINSPPSLIKQRKTMANVQTMGFFGLGAPEIIIILIAGAFVLGPQKLAELGKEAGKMSSDLKELSLDDQRIRNDYAVSERLSLTS
jgi:hypothetical protein